MDREPDDRPEILSAEEADLLLVRRLRSQHHDLRQEAYYTPSEHPTWDATEDAAVTIEALRALVAEREEQVVAAMRMHRVQWERANRAEALVAERTAERDALREAVEVFVAFHDTLASEWSHEDGVLYLRALAAARALVPPKAPEEPK